MSSDTGKPFSNRVNDFFILSPKTSPFEIIDILRGSLWDNKLPQSLDNAPFPHNTYTPCQPPIVSWVGGQEGVCVPRTVGNLGSSQPVTIPWSTNHCNFLLLNTVLTKFNRLNPITLTDLIDKAFNIHAYCASRSLYSKVRNACVTPSRQSTMGHAKS
jgi:hypothetical protein